MYVDEKISQRLEEELDELSGIRYIRWYVAEKAMLRVSNVFMPLEFEQTMKMVKMEYRENDEVEHVSKEFNDELVRAMDRLGVTRSFYLKISVIFRQIALITYPNSIKEVLSKTHLTI